MSLNDDLAFMHYLQKGMLLPSIRRAALRADGLCEPTVRSKACLKSFGYKSDGFDPRFDESKVPEIYVWRTRGDGKVSAEHAANNGKIFTRDNPPSTGHPGQRYGCRCVAQAYGAGILTFILDKISDWIITRRIWTNLELSAHFYVGGGEAVTLEEIGLLDAVKQDYEREYLGLFLEQMREKSRSMPEGFFADNFDNSYNFIGTLYSFRNAGVRGSFVGEIKTNEQGERRLEGNAVFEFYDSFKDPLDIAETFAKTGAVFIEGFSEKDLWKIIKDGANIGGKPYKINGKWVLGFVSFPL